MRFFNRFIFQTPESVELEFTLAGIGNRALALIIDYIVLGLILIVLLVIWAIVSFLISSYLGEIAANQLALWLLAIQLLIIFSTYVSYFVFFETLWQGQTPGKRWVKIRVLRDDGRPIRLQQATLRALLRPIDDLLFLGVFFIIFGKGEKRIGDWVAGTIVIQEEQPFTSATFPISEKSHILAEKLQIEADMFRLLPQDFAVIREYLQRRGQMLTPARRELARQLAYQVKDIIALEDVPDGVSANLFLEAVYLAYQQKSSTT